MNTKRSKRWNGNLDSLSTDFLKDVIEKMESYGPSVQFELPGNAQRPNYQVINNAGKKMAFDKKNLLMSLNSDGNVSNTLSAVFTLEAVKTAMKGGGAKTVARARTSRPSTAGGTRSGPAPAAQIIDTVEHDKYGYFKANRETLPEGIQKHSAEISTLMKNGMSAEEAFGEIIKQHF
ncbi:hypothetical protein CR155_09920 [Pollutimonas nitritireducens]|uniref:Uncharacterized protein n=1 Tax=Pollutimonas nitritireducens TaxID=2045209 RepID=A0A2N4UFG5_9BURK|nr:hypothetical protein [Pollutimonas nitritireducens]PLC53763.1 hypothetical protein CR155_09920 [Pollutimonas nitritireducens]